MTVDGGGPVAELRKILYADDEADIREIVELTLTTIGQFEVLVCQNGADAVEKAEGFGADLFLLDVMMPGMTGPETLQRLRRRPEAAHTPVIFITARAHTDEMDELLRVPQAGIITKPFDPMTLANEIKGIWQELVAS
ncbi:response regulator [Roseibium litorale]|uniref:Response regulator n=1 Tax=Roseibium litorale TaxID=2803841 RepID=A0ABR9CTP3_9HYPH|nr:response regulator [Roseibium litorale]MBD8893652.1 response regulator [Roseibium litorale]